MENQNNRYGSLRKCMVDIIPIPTVQIPTLIQWLCKLQNTDFLWFNSRDNWMLLFIHIRTRIV